MKRTTKFPLKMPNGSLVKELEELQDNFDLQAVMEYFGNGQLQLWLKNNYNDDIFEEVSVLTGDEEDFILRLTTLLGVDYNNEDINVQSTIIKSKLKNELGEIFEQYKIDEIIDYVVENQIQLNKMLSKGIREIYLYKNEFFIDDKVKNVKFIGISNPRLTINNYNEQRFISQKVWFENIDVIDENGQKIEINNYIGLIESVLDIFESMLLGGVYND